MPLRPIARSLLALGLTLGLWAAAAAAEETQSARLTPAEAEVVERVESYLNGIDTLRARFVQASSNGAQATGEVYLKRPGNVRFEYDPPHPGLILANDDLVLYYDRELEQASYIPLSRTPLWFLLRGKIDVDAEDDLHLAGVERGEDSVSLTIPRPENAGEAAGAVTLVFARDPMELRRWRILDPQGITTEITLVEAETGVSIDDKQFSFGALDIPRPGAGGPAR